MQENDLIKNLDLIISKGFPFACWSLPGSTDWECYLQKDDTKYFLDDALNDGFIISPFESKSEIRSIRPEYFFSNKKPLSFDITIWHKNVNRTSKAPHEVTYEDYIRQCEALIKELRKSTVNKVVLSRVRKHKLKVPASVLFNAMRKAYPKAMVFIYRLEDSLWIGASPETFLQTNKGQIETMALAGSKAANSDKEWTFKEKEEHAYVEAFIENVLVEEGVEFLKQGPDTVIAGPVAHLKSIYEGRFNKRSLIPFIQKLHPTPAVCGIPSERARLIIKSIEKHDRSDYTGFIGPLVNKEIKLFVNLRSGKIIDDDLYLFLGGGITKDSDPIEEWKETELKAQTLLSIL